MSTNTGAPPPPAQPTHLGHCYTEAQGSGHLSQWSLRPGGRGRTGPQNLQGTILPSGHDSWLQNSTRHLSRTPGHSQLQTSAHASGGRRPWLFLPSHAVPLLPVPIRRRNSKGTGGGPESNSSYQPHRPPEAGQVALPLAAPCQVDEPPDVPCLPVLHPDRPLPGWAGCGGGGGEAVGLQTSPVPRLKTRIGRPDFLHNTTLATKALFPSEAVHKHLGELVSMPPLSGNQGICSDTARVSSSRAATVPIATPRPVSPPVPTMESEEERNSQPCKTQKKRNPFFPKIMKSKNILLLLGHSSFL